MKSLIGARLRMCAGIMVRVYKGPRFFRTRVYLPSHSASNVTRSSRKERSARRWYLFVKENTVAVFGEEDGIIVEFGLREGVE